MFEPSGSPLWGWTAHSVHRDALQIVWDEAACDPQTIGLLICGSVARGDALPGSDLDVRVFLSPDSATRPFDAQTLGGVWVERTYLSPSAARERLGTRPMEPFPYREGKIVRDDTGELAQLVAFAEASWQAYVAPAAEKAEMHYWLQATERKVASAWKTGQHDKAAYVATTSAWPLLTGLFLAANRPLPPSGAVLANLPDAARRVGVPVEIVSDVWAAQTTEGRVNAALTVLASVLPRLKEAD